jgi:hypothetical protein
MLVIKPGCPIFASAKIFRGAFGAMEKKHPVRF